MPVHADIDCNYVNAVTTNTINLLIKESLKMPQFTESEISEKIASGKLSNDDVFFNKDTGTLNTIQNAAVKIISSNGGNFNSTVDPVATDNKLLGYGSGAVWINLNTTEAFINVSNTTNSNATWLSITDGAGAVSGFSTISNVGTGISIVNSTTSTNIAFKSIAALDSSIDILQDLSQNTIQIGINEVYLVSQLVHGGLQNLTDYDDHLQYMLLAGRGTSQTLIGGVNTTSNLILQSTSHINRGNIILNDTTILLSTLSVNGATTLNSILNVSGDTFLRQILNVTGATTLASTLSVGGNAKFAANVSIDGSLNVSGDVSVNNGKQLHLYDTNGKYIGLKAPLEIIPTSYTLTLPGSLGNSGQVLTLVDGSGNLTWGTVSLGGNEVFLGGNTVSSNMNIGTNNAYDLSLIIGTTTCMTINQSADVTIPNGNLNVSGDVFMYSTLSVNGASAFNSILNVSGDTNLRQILNVTGATILASTLSVGRDAKFATNVSIDGSLNVSGDVSVNNGRQLRLYDTNGKYIGLNAPSDIASTPYNLTLPRSLGNSGQVLKLIDGNGNLTWDTIVLGGNEVLIGGNIVSSNLNIGTNSTYDLSLIVGTTTCMTINQSADVTIPNGNLNVSGDVFMYSTLSVNGATALNSILNVSGDTNLRQVLNVTGATILASTLSVGRDAKFATNVSIDGSLNISGDVSVNNGRQLRLYDTNDKYIGLNAPSQITSTYTVDLPTNNGTVGQILRTNGNGKLSWTHTKYPFRSMSSDYTLTANDQVIECTGPMNVTLPSTLSSPNGDAGTIYMIIKAYLNGQIIIATDATDTIGNTDTSITLSGESEHVTLLSNGSHKWYTI
jgi:cytoskeletal protein CcmA (bactofilin family)